MKVSPTNRVIWFTERTARIRPWLGRGLHLVEGGAFGVCVGVTWTRRRS